MRLREQIEKVLGSGSAGLQRPVLRKGSESSVPGLHVIGDLAGAPVIKLAMAQGVEVVDYIASLPEMRGRSRAGEGGRAGARSGAGGRASAGEGAGGRGGAAAAGRAATDGPLDILVVGAGAAGLNAALAAREKGLSCLVLEKEKIANTIENFPEGKWVYAEPDATPSRGKLWLDGARKEDLVARWHAIVRDNGLDVRTEEPLESLSRQKDGAFVVRTPRGEYRARRVILATGQRGNPRKLGVPGEDQERVYHRLYSPRKYRGEQILVVGGGNSAVEAALTLSEQNRVVISYRGGEFSRLFKDNRKKLDKAMAERRIEVVFHSTVKEFRRGEAVLGVDRGGVREERVVRADHAFVLVGAELPVAFLKSLGIRLENEWTGAPLRAAGLTLAAFVGLWIFGALLGGSAGPAALAGAAASGSGLVSGAVSGVARILAAVPPWAGGLLALASLAALVVTGAKGDRWSWLGLSFFAWYSIYGIKYGKGEEFWPYRGWGYEALSLFDRPWAFWYTVLYTALMTVFGLQALKRWGLDRRDKFQIWRYASLLSFQWIFFFIIPEFLFNWAVQYRWVGERLVSDPQFAEQAWRSYGLVYAWPLFFYTFFYDPHKIWVVWGVLLTFVVIPVFVLFHGKRYCSWICGCGGLAETFGDRWRHLAPKGKTSIRWEWMNLAVLILAAAVTLFMLGRDSFRLLSAPADWGIHLYRVLADVWLVGILPVTLYPFLGGKVWCRYWCPLAKLMQIFSKAYTKLGISRFRILANDKCIACNECSRNCQVGIDVMQYALKQEPLDNATSSCIGCGICVTVCPMDTLSFVPPPSPRLPMYEPQAPAH